MLSDRTDLGSMNGSVGGEGGGGKGGYDSTFFPYFISQSPDFIRRQTDLRAKNPHLSGDTKWLLYKIRLNSRPQRR